VCSAQCIGHWTALCTTHYTAHYTAALDTKVEQDLDFIIYFLNDTWFQVPYGPLNL
jgi:hypothetical protein